MPKYSLLIDHELCWGCKTCEVACKQEFHTPEGVKLIRVEEIGPRLVEGKVDFSFHVNVCQHCDRLTRYKKIADIAAWVLRSGACSGVLRV